MADVPGARRGATPLAALALSVGLVLVSCASEPGTRSGDAEASRTPGAVLASGQLTVRATTIDVDSTPPGAGRPARARLSIPRLGISGLRVEPYRGRTDDARGTAIQDGGSLASPHGPRGGVGPGGVGNYQVTGHRLSSTRPFRHLPMLDRGDRVAVQTATGRYVYRVIATRRTSFRSAASLREQRAAVPGRPGMAPSRAMITLSTCATVEDHAAGNYWSDRFDNPEHRIDKIGVLVASRPS